MCIFIGQVYRKNLKNTHISSFNIYSFKYGEKEFNWKKFGNIILMERGKKNGGF